MSKEQKIFKLREEFESSEEHIELILEEANAYGLRYEVQKWTEKYMDEDPELSKLDATIMAYSEWIK